MEWRTVVAMLANPDTRRALARVIVESEDAPSTLQAQRGLARLTEAGLVTNGRVDASALRALLAENARPQRVGPARFLTPSGRLIAMPSRPGDRLELLRLIAARVLQPGEVVTERQLGDRLAAFDDDVATLRRLLVEAGLLERTPTGTEYALVPGFPNGS